MCFPRWAQATAASELEAKLPNQCRWVKMPLKDSKLPPGVLVTLPRDLWRCPPALLLIAT